MKIRFFLLLIIFQGISVIGFSQIVSSSCDAPDSIKALYQDDADRLALEKILAYHLPYEDSILIPVIYSDSFLNPLLAVYNATSIPERDTVVTVFKIHEFPDYALNTISIAADSTLPWMQTLRQGIQPSGNMELDSMLNQYGLAWYDYETYYNWFEWHVVYFKSESNYNMKAMQDALEVISEVSFADLAIYHGDGDHIFMQREEFPFPATLVTYFLGWGDCLAGCTDGRSWVFRVYDDCSVEFVGAYGSHVPFTATSEVSPARAYILPNPFTDFIQIAGLNENVIYSISDVLGIQSKSGISDGGKIDDLDNLFPGMYYLTILQEGKRSTFSILKN